MKRFIYSFLVAIALLVPAMNIVATSSVGAVDLFNGVCTGNNDTKTNASGTDLCKDKTASSASKQNPILRIIGIAIDLLAFVIGVASVIMIVISGMRMVLSRGDAQSIANARNAIIYALVGLAIAAVAGTLVSLVLNNL